MTRSDCCRKKDGCWEIGGSADRDSAVEDASSASPWAAVAEAVPVAVLVEGVFLVVLMVVMPVGLASAVVMIMN